LDERSDSINDGFFGVDMSNTGTRDGSGAPNPYWLIDYPADYHNGAANVSFADGHVERHRWLEPTTLVPLGPARQPHLAHRPRREMGSGPLHVPAVTT
jgi:prepilin-type processing-associated H-X9-DG protein